MVFFLFQLESAVQSLAIVQGDGQSEGEEALSQFGHEFLASVHSAAVHCAKERDDLAQEIQAVKQMQEQHANDELVIFKPLTEEDVKSDELKKVGRKESSGDEKQLQEMELRDDSLDRHEKPGGSSSGAESEIKNKPAVKPVSPSSVQNGVKPKSVADKRRGLPLKSPSGSNQRQPIKTRRNSDRGTALKPPTPTRGIPTPATSRSRASSRSTPTPPTNHRSSSMSNIPLGSKGKVPAGKSVPQSGSSIPKLSPRSGIPRACSTPSRLSQQAGGEGADRMGSEGALLGSGEDVNRVRSDDGNQSGDV